ncbi:MAG TPA: hypothetical protein VFF60_04350 [Candidatus Binatus sp.]|nr:hypothetical protein [Candidatus Binatus sp.]
MTLELWNTFATFGTFIVIAATAIAALVQLRHTRGSNQIAAVQELRDAQETPQFTAADHWVATELASKIKDPEFRYQVVHRADRTAENQMLIARVTEVGNHYENIGSLIKRGLIDRDIALDLWSDVAVSRWGSLASYNAITREAWGSVIWENFEYFVVLSQDWLASHPNGDYPPGVRRIDLKNEWREADRQYAASRSLA